MSRYVCNRCGYESFSKRNAERHIIKAIPCKGDDKLELILNIIKDVINCDKCGKKYDTFDSLKRHQKTSCKIINQEKLQEENRKLKEELEKLKGTTNNTTNNTTNITTNNNNSKNVQINNNYITISLTPYNDPNMQGMQQYLEAALRKTFLSVPNLIESVHFNKEYPENQNICITNRRTKDAKVFDGKKWKTVNKELLISEILDTYEREITNYAEEQGKVKFIKEYNNAKKRGNAEKDLKEEVHNVIYDNSDKVNTKIKEVQKQIKEIEQQSESESEADSNSEPPLLDEYEEFRKQLESESDSEDSKD